MSGRRVASYARPTHTSSTAGGPQPLLLCLALCSADGDDDDVDDGDILNVCVCPASYTRAICKPNYNTISYFVLAVL